MTTHRTAAALLALLCASGGALADTRHVPGEYATIQGAIDASLDGDVVLVADGVYTGPGNRDMDFGGRAITVRSSGGTENCTIDIGASEIDPHRAFHFHSGESAASALEGFTITNGFMDRGGAVLIETGSSPTITDCSFESCTASVTADYTGGGAIAIYEGQPTITSCSFDGNSVRNASRPSGGGAVYIRSGDVLVEDCVFTGNTATGDGDGGALAGFGGAMTLINSTFTANTADFGGAIVSAEHSQMTLTGCTFTANTSEAAGAVETNSSDMTQTDCTYVGNSSLFAGAVLDGASVATYTNCTFEGNFTIDTGDDNSGGAYIANGGASVTMTGCVFTNNTAGGSSSGGVGMNDAVLDLTACEFIGNTAEIGGGVYANVSSIVTMRHCHLEGNVATLRGGGVFFGIFQTQATIIGCTFIGNTAPEGGAGGIQRNTVATFTNTLFANNTASGFGGALLVGAGGGQDAFITVVNSTFTQNQSIAGGAIYAQPGGHATVTNSILWNDAPGEIQLEGSGTAVVSYSNVEGGYDGEGNIDEDPLFVHPDAGNFSLASWSPCIDAGDSTAVPGGTVTDLADNPRFHDDPWTPDMGIAGDAEAVVDMGAYEFQGASCPADLNGDGLVDFADFLEFLNFYDAGDLRADFNGDGLIDFADYLEFLNHYDAGC